ncbi:MAG: hypothetical protein WCF90_10940 [Methanomicrobiales archaeon]
MNTKYDLPSLAMDATHSYPFDAMVLNVKAVVTYENSENVVFSKLYPLSALGNYYEPCKPMIPPV